MADPVTIGLATATILGTGAAVYSATKSKPPKPPPPAPMPDPADQMAARKRAATAAQGRSGFDSTILSGGGGKLGPGS